MHLKGVTGLIPTEAFCCIVVVPLLDCMIQIVVIVPVLAELLFTVFLTLFSTLHLFRLVLLTINRRSYTITEKAPNRAFSWLKVPNSGFTFKNLLRPYAKLVLTRGK